MANLKNIKKGDKVILRLFTGAFVEAKVVEMADAKKIGFTNKAGVKMVFDKATGKQITPEPKNARFANYLDDWDEKTEKEEAAKKLKKKEQKSAPAKATKKQTPKNSSKKAKVTKPTDDDDFEEVE